MLHPAMAGVAVEAGARRPQLLSNENICFFYHRLDHDAGLRFPALGVKESDKEIKVKPVSTTTGFFAPAVKAFALRAGQPANFVGRNQ